MKWRVCTNRRLHGTKCDHVVSCHYLSWREWCSHDLSIHMLVVTKNLARWWQIQTDRFLSHKFWSLINIVCPSKQYCRRFPDIIKCIFFNENLFSLIIFSLKLIPNGPVDNESELVQMMAWCRQPLSHYLTKYRPTSMSCYDMMTSSNGNIFRVTRPLWGEYTGHMWIPLTKASDAEFWCFLWCASEQADAQTIETPVITDAITLMMTSM